jgi:nucleoside phosphorylase
MELRTPILKLASILKSRKEGHSRLYHLLLANDQETDYNLESYRALARLIKDGYFSSILTTQRDLSLEQAIGESGLHPFAFRSLIFGQDDDEQIVAALDGLLDGISIVKLLRDSDESFSEELPVHPRLSASVFDSFQRYLGNDIVIVGSIQQERILLEALHENLENSIYYVMRQIPTLDESLLKIMNERGRSYEDFLISDFYGESETFFKVLESILLSRESNYVAALVPAAIGATEVLLPARTSQPVVSQKNLSVQVFQDVEVVRKAVISESSRTSSEKHRIISDNKKILADVLLVTVTAVEARALLDIFPERRGQIQHIDNRTYHDFGIVNDARVFMVQLPQKGSGGTGGSRFTVEEGIKALSPSAIIMVGIALGLDTKKLHVGDILVSEHLLDYDPQRVGSGSDDKQVIYQRGYRVEASERLLDRFVAGQHTIPQDWPNPPAIHFGLILSGAKLVDNKAYRDQLRAIAPEALGGEMEGAGVHEAAARNKIDWILVKAVSDWGDGSKARNEQKNQKLAASNAARFTVHVIRQGGFKIQKRRRI